jgi:hypothetical protein
MENILWKQATDPQTPGVQTLFTGREYNVLALFYQGIIMTGKKYFYAKGQSARARGWSKGFAESYYLNGASDYARIAFDAGFRGLRMN